MKTNAEVLIPQDTHGYYFIRIEDEEGTKEVRLGAEEFPKAVTGKLAKGTTSELG